MHRGLTPVARRPRAHSITHHPQTRRGAAAQLGSGTSAEATRERLKTWRQEAETNSRTGTTKWKMHMMMIFLAMQRR